MISQIKRRVPNAILLSFLISLSLFVQGCKFFGPDLKPTVRELRNTIKSMRQEDYEKGRVFYSSTASINSSLLNAKIERLKLAENDASEALDEPHEHNLLKPKKAGSK